ncbi:MAG: hypothetical protein Q7S57_02400 [bacterium]|nr:hypothetical protein [bacterium]
MARLLREMGHDVSVCLQTGQSAYDSWKSSGKVWQELKWFDVAGKSGAWPQLKSTFDAVLLAMSPVIGANSEIGALMMAHEDGVPAFGVSDFPGSLRNPGWRDYVRHLTTLFSPMPEPNFPGKCVVSGWGALEKWRNKDVGAMAYATRLKLGIGHEPVLYVFFSPERESPLALEHLAILIREVDIDGITIVVNRHGREKSTPVDGNARRFRVALCLLGENNRVFDNSPEYSEFLSLDERSILPQFRPDEFLEYQEALTLARGNGVALTMFGTDGLLAPYLASSGILSVCWLDPVYGGAVLKREKQVERLDLPILWQPTNDLDLLTCIDSGLRGRSDAREKQIELLEQQYPFPKSSAPQIIVDEILRQLG